MSTKQKAINYTADESPAKMYHFREVKDQLDRMESGLSDVTKKLELQANNQVTAKYLEDRLVAMSTAFTNKLTSELKDRDVRMNNFEATVANNNKNFKWFTRATIVSALGIISSAVAIIYFTSIKP